MTPIIRLVVSLALAAALFGIVTRARAVTIDTVPVGDVGNPNDPATGNLYGGVSYAFNIGKYEVTVGQYTEFLNAVASTDTYGLYNPSMATDLNIAGIAQSCSPNCTYSVVGSPNHPVTYVSWDDAARFTNWLHNGQPTGAQDATTTEDGAYALGGARSSLAVNRNPGASWFIPTENEWYKAAYYQPAAQGGDADSYWAYSMKTNSVPYSSQPPGATPDNTRVGNFYKNDFLANGYDDGDARTGCFAGTERCLTEVGAYTSSPGYYGTFDQGGNVREWNETRIGPSRGARGGSWGDVFDDLQAAARRGFGPSSENSIRGFRVATIFVPEPSTFLLAAAVLGLRFACRRRT